MAVFEITLEKMVHGGLALARLEDGRVALVSGGLPGERVRAALQERAGVLQGVVTGVLEPHPGRVAQSPHPGLDYSFIADALQLQLKQQVVEDALWRAGLRISVPDVVAAPCVWHYRNTIQPAVTFAAGKTALGYRAPGSHEVTPLQEDPVAQRGLQRAWTSLQAKRLPKGVREIVLRGNDADEVLICLIASASAKNYLDFAHALCKGGVAGVSYAKYDPRGRFRSGAERLAGVRQIVQRYGEVKVSMSATSFAQPNPGAASQLYKDLTRLAGGGEHALDLYAGSGVIGMHLAPRFKQVTVLEIDKSSVARAQRDAERLGLGNLSFLRADARKLGALPEAELIVVDPPRAGLAKDTRQSLSASGASRLIYVSCDVATWARDVADLQKQGWHLETAQPYDFYPQTHHIEMLSVLGR